MEWQWVDYIEAMSAEEFDEWKHRVETTSITGRRIIAIEYESVYTLGEQQVPEMPHYVYGS